jgi:hypothetical protein
VKLDAFRIKLEFYLNPQIEIEKDGVSSLGFLFYC